MTVYTVSALQALPEIEVRLFHEELGLAPCTISCTESCTFTCGPASCTHTAFVEQAELERLQRQVPPPPPTPQQQAR